MPVKFVAEVSSNHNKDFERSKEFIRVAASIGCQAVKFQLFKIDTLFSPEVLTKSKSHRERKAWELPGDFIPKLAAFSHQLNLEFACTPFYLEAVDELEPYIDFYKISSYELLWQDLLRKTALTHKPIVLSTGMATLDEISDAVSVISNTGNTKLTLLHCISGYPTPPEEANLKSIQTLRSYFKYPVGWSDHTVQPAVIHRAIHHWGAELIEFHLDLEGKGEEYKTGHCWLPSEIEAVIQSTNLALSADGDGEKIPSPSEKTDRDWRADPSDGLRPLKHIRKNYTP